MEITGLALITLIMTGILLFFPKLTNAPKNEDMPVQVAPVTVLNLDNVSDNDHVTPKQVITGTVPGF